MEDKKIIEAELCGLKNLLEEKFKQNDRDHKEIIEQTTKTNGSVRTLQIWRGYITGAIAVIMTIVVPLFVLLARFYLEK
jgi:hypothetical protein